MPQPSVSVTAAPATNSASFTTSSPTNYRIISRAQHNISRQSISENALKVLYRLNRQGYEAFLVGGCVRDLLLGNKPKDFDIATNATPEQVQKTFRNCRLVGRRFRLAHIMFGSEIIEVATFRGDHDVEENEPELNNNVSKRSQSGMLLRDNVYGNIEQDAIRRDFTINSLYYSVKDFSIRDYCNGMADLQKGLIRLIGDPQTRYREDPVRMLRALRFAAKLNMTIDKQTAAPIKKLATLLKSIPGPRLFDESLKLLQSGYGYQTYLLLKEYALLGLLFPCLEPYIDHEKQSSQYTSHAEKMIMQVLKNTDSRIANQQRVNPAFLYAAFFWYPVSERAQTLMLEGGLTFHDAFSLAMNDILDQQCAVLSIPKRLTTVMYEIWRLQLRFNKRSGKRAYVVFEHQKFRAAYDLLALRSTIEKGELLELVKWWDEFQHSNAEKQESLIQQHVSLPTNKTIKKSHPKKRYRKPISHKKETNGE